MILKQIYNNKDNKQKQEILARGKSDSQSCHIRTFEVYSFQQHQKYEAYKETRKYDQLTGNKGINRNGP